MYGIGNNGRGRVLPPLLLLTVVAAATRLHLATAVTFDYALQVEPVTFFQDPLSQTALLDTTVTLTCNASAEPLVSGYPIITMAWRLNGGTIVRKTTSKPDNWSIKSYSPGHSELTVVGVTSQDAGYYECLALDGEVDPGIFAGGPKWNYITVSKRARLEVITPLPVDIYYHREVRLGQPLLLPCRTGVAGDKLEKWTWSKDGMSVNDSQMDVLYLSDGGLLVLRTAESAAGSYQCTAWIGHQPLNSTTFNITISQDLYVGPPELFINPVSQVQVPAGQNFTITCYITGGTAISGGYSLKWLKGNEGAVTNQSASDTHILQVVNSDVSHSGNYACELTAGNQTYRSEATAVTITEAPSFTGPQVREELLPRIDDTYNSLLYLIEGHPPSSVHCYKDGQNIEFTLTNVTGPQNLLSVGYSEGEALAVYQCFADSVAGSSVITTRVLLDGFSNPPGDLMCSPKYAGTNWTAVLDWRAPKLYRSSLVTTDDEDVLANYLITYTKPSNGIPNKREEYGTHFDEILYYSSEGVYDFKLTVLLPVDSYDRFESAALRCSINTLDRVTEEVYNLTKISCDSKLVEFAWNNPAAILGGSGLYISNGIISGMCIDGNNTAEGNFTWSEDTESVKPMVKLNLVNVSEGAVCLFGGTYVFGGFTKQDVDRFIHPATCRVPYLQEVPCSSVELGLTCTNSSEVTVYWNSSKEQVQNVTITGRCVSYSQSPSRTIYSEVLPPFTTSEPTGNWTPQAISPDTVACSFFVSYSTLEGEQEINPLQCVMGMEDSPPPPPCVPDPQTSVTNSIPGSSVQAPSALTSDIIVTPNPSIQIPSASSSPSKDHGVELGLWWLLIAAVVVLVAVVLLAAIVLYLCWLNHRKTRFPFSKQQAEDAQAVAEEMFGRKQGVSSVPITIPSFYPYSGVDIDTKSVVTVYDSICGPLQPSSIIPSVSRQSLLSIDDNGIPIKDGKPEILDRFLNSQQQPQAWTSSALPSPTRTGSTINEAIYDPMSPLPTSLILTAESSTKNESTPPVLTVQLDTHNTHQTVQGVNSSATASSSGYATDSYFVSDTSCSYPAAYFAARVKEVEDTQCKDRGLQKAALSLEGPLHATSKGKVLDVTAVSDKEDNEHIQSEAKLSIATKHYHLTQESKQSSATATNLCVHTQTAKEARPLRLDSVVRSIRVCTYNYIEDDEGYVHMSSAECTD